MPFDLMAFFPSVRIPNADDLVSASCGKSSAVGRYGHSVYGILMGGAWDSFLPCRQVPKANCLVCAAEGKRLAIRCISQNDHLARRQFLSWKFLARSHIPPVRWFP